MQNWDKWIMLILIIAVLFILFRMNKVMASQTTMMMNIAQHMGMNGASPPRNIPAQQQQQNQQSASPPTSNEPAQETEEDGKEIVRIADKLIRGKKLTKAEQEFQAKFSAQIEEEKGFSIQEEMTRIALEIKKDGAEVTQEEIDFYQHYFPAFKEHLQAEHQIDFEVQKITIKPPIEAEKAKEILDEAGKKHLILTLFADGIPKYLTQLASLVAKESGRSVSNANTAKVLDKLLEEQKLKNEKRLYKSRNSVFYGLPEWFEKNGKMKKEYVKNIK